MAWIGNATGTKRALFSNGRAKECSRQRSRRETTIGADFRKNGREGRTTSFFTMRKYLYQINLLEVRTMSTATHDNQMQATVQEVDLNDAAWNEVVTTKLPAVCHASGTHHRA